MFLSTSKAPLLLSYEPSPCSQEYILLKRKPNWKLHGKPPACGQHCIGSVDVSTHDCRLLEAGWQLVGTLASSGSLTRLGNWQPTDWVGSGLGWEGLTLPLASSWGWTCSCPVGGRSRLEQGRARPLRVQPRPDTQPRLPHSMRKNQRLKSGNVLCFIVAGITNSGAECVNTRKGGLDPKYILPT